MGITTFKRMRERASAEASSQDLYKKTLEELKELARGLGITFNARIGKNTLIARIKEHGKNNGTS